MRVRFALHVFFCLYVQAAKFSNFIQPQKNRKRLITRSQKVPPRPPRDNTRLLLFCCLSFAFTCKPRNFRTLYSPRRTASDLLHARKKCHLDHLATIPDFYFFAAYLLPLRASLVFFDLYVPRKEPQATYYTLAKRVTSIPSRQYPTPALPLLIFCLFALCLPS